MSPGNSGIGLKAKKGNKGRKGSGAGVWQVTGQRLEGRNTLGLEKRNDFPQLEPGQPQLSSPT